MAQVVKSFVCLANSRKLSGRCIAGREMVDGRPEGWLRPVSDREREEVSEYERQYEDGSDPGLLDIIDIALISPRPNRYQTENWLLDPEVYWSKSTTFPWDDLHQLTDPIEDLWSVGSSTVNGQNDRISFAEARKLKSSLRLIELRNLTVSVFAPGKTFGNKKRRVQACFSHNHQDYKLWITDPEYERRYLKMANGDYTIGPCYATISTGEPHRGYCYKFVAAIIEPPE